MNGIRRNLISSSGGLRGRTGGESGFTIIELVTTIAIIAILMILAAPSFLTFRKNAQLTTAINNLSASLSAARTEAMRRSASTTVIPIDKNNWANGWKATVASDDTIVIDSQGPVSAIASDITITLSDSLPKEGMQFNGDGYPQAIGGGGFLNASLQLTNGIRTRKLILAPTGQIRVCDPNASAGASDACP